MPEIILNNITKRWGNFYGVKNLNLVIKDHSFVTLLGPSGCGKTTTLRMIAGLETPTSGEILIDGKVVYSSNKGINVPPNKRNVGFLFQNYALWPHMTVYKNIAFGLENLKWKKDKIKARVEELLKMLKIEEFAKRYPSELSGGQQQRVAIARTLAPNPQVLFMDEPLSNLDAKLRLEMRTELKRLHMETNSTFVYVTHDQLEAMTLATEVCLMEKGLLQQYDPPLTVYANPNNLFVADFVGNPTMNFINSRVTKRGDKNVELDFGDFKAEFTSNESINLEIPPIEEPIIEEEDNNKKKKKEKVKKVAELVQNEEEEVKYDINDVVIGIRPEYIRLSETDGVDATIYSSLPSGMETIVKIKVGESILTSVVFGIIDYPVDTKVKVLFEGDKIVLFSRSTNRRITDGKLTINIKPTKPAKAKAKEDTPVDEKVEEKPAPAKKMKTVKKDLKSKSANYISHFLYET